MSRVATTGWRYARSGPIAEVLRRETYELDKAVAADKVLVRLLAAPLHRVDAAVINGTALGCKKVNLPRFPRVGGCEGVGQVIAVGAGKDAHGNVKEGDVVWLAPLQGSWASAVTAEAAYVHPLPQLSAQAQQQSGGLPLTTVAFASNLLTAWQLLHRYVELQPGEVVIQNGGSSATALAVALLAKQMRLQVLSAAAPGERFDAAHARFARHQLPLFPYNSAGMRAMREAMGGRDEARLFLNGVGGRHFDSFLSLMRPYGHVVTYGAQCGYGLFISSAALVHKELTLQGHFLPSELYTMSYADRQRELDTVLAALAEVQYAYPVLETHDLDKLPEVWDETFVHGGRKAIVLAPPSA